MYEETAYFDPNGNIMLDGVRTELHLPHEVMGEAAAASRTNSHSGGGGCDDDGHTAVDLRIPSMEQGRAASAIELELERQLQMDMQQYSEQNLDENELYVIQQHQQQQIIHQQQQQQQLDDPDQIARPLDHQSNWEQVEMQNVNQHQHQNHQMFSSPPSHPHPTADLLNLFHLPNPSLSYAAAAVIDSNNNASSSVMYDPLFHLNLPPQPPMFRDLFQSNGYSLTTGSSRLGSSIFGDDGEASGGVVYQGGDSGILEFAAAEVARGRGRNGKATPNFTTDRHRRNHMSNKYQALKDLVPNPTKNDRASIVQDAIEYIHEQMRTVKELKILVEKKRCSRDKRKRHKTGDDHGGESNAKNGDGGGGGGDSTDQYYNGALLSSWIQRKTKDTEVDVRIIDDDVTIKLVQRKKMNCLLLVSKFLDELHLDLQHVAGGHIGDFYSFLFNAKIYEGSSLYASAIANKLIEVVDKQYAAAAPSNFSSSY